MTLFKKVNGKTAALDKFDTDETGPTRGEAAIRIRAWLLTFREKKSYNQL